jgi:hypothetical protein
MTVARSVQEEIAGVLIAVCLLSAAEMKIFGSFLGVLLKIFARKTEMEKKYCFYKRVSEISSQQIRSWTGVLLVNKFCRFRGKRVLFAKEFLKKI